MPETRAKRQPLLSSDALACRRGDRLLWRGLSLTLTAGQAIHIAGPNGIGKSSLIRILSGLLPPAHGSVATDARIAMIDERHAIDADVPLSRALEWWADIDGAERGSIPSALEHVGIPHLAEAPLRIFSTGQRKRAALARLLLSGAPIWLLDEPANGLDSDGVALLETLVAQHLAGGGGAIIASHLPVAVPGLDTISIADFVP